MQNPLEPHLPWRNFEFCVLRASHKDERMSPHSHDFCELVFVHEGKALHQVGDKSYRIQAGDLFIIPPGVSHWYDDANIGIYNLLFSKSFMEQFASDLSGFANFQLLFHLSEDLPLTQRLISLDSSFFPELTRLLDDVIDEEERNVCGSRIAVFSDVTRIILMICRHSHPAGDSKKLHHAYRISHLMAEWENGYGLSWSLESMAERAKMSVSNFRQEFKNLTGKSPIDYLLGVRLKKASEMLCLQTKTIGEISSLCGFEDSNYFTRLFKKTMGRSPREYRKMIERRNFRNSI